MYFTSYYVLPVYTIKSRDLTNEISSRTGRDGDTYIIL